MTIERLKNIVNWKNKMGLAITLGLMVGIIWSIYGRITYVSDNKYDAISSTLDANKEKVSQLSKEIEDNNAIIENFKQSPEFKKGN